MLHLGLRRSSSPATAVPRGRPLAAVRTREGRFSSRAGAFSQPATEGAQHYAPLRGWHRASADRGHRLLLPPAAPRLAKGRLGMGGRGSPAASASGGALAPPAFGSSSRATDDDAGGPRAPGGAPLETRLSLQVEHCRPTGGLPGGRTLRGARGAAAAPLAVAHTVCIRHGVSQNLFTGMLSRGRRVLVQH